MKSDVDRTAKAKTILASMHFQISAGESMSLRDQRFLWNILIRTLSREGASDNELRQFTKNLGRISK